MSDFERKKIISNKNKSFFRDASANGKTDGRAYSNRLSSATSKERDPVLSETKIKQPTILLKNRDLNVEETTVNIKKKPKDAEQSLSGSQGTKENEGSVPVLKHMKKSMKLMEDGIINTEPVHDYLQENTDFLVVGIIGTQGVGKSTILNLLSEQKVTQNLKDALFKQQAEATDIYENGVTILTQQLENTHLEDKTVFKTQTLEDIENCINTTYGIDLFVSSNRVIFLDCQPFASAAVLNDLIECENKRTNLVSEFIPLENSGEIQGLQYTAFLMSVCHILLVVQDWFFDSNVVRFVQTAEMLKPTISNPEDEYSEHFPHLIMVHNRAQMADFTPKQFKSMQQVYQALFQKTKLQFQSNLGLGSGRIINTLNPDMCGDPVNLFLIPEYGTQSEGFAYSGHPPLEDLIKRLKANLFVATKNPLTHVQLTEKNWLMYCNKVWETVKKSPFFVEYTKLMP